MTAGALKGLLVVALEQAVAAPLCTSRLADGGARVIKIERPEGETARHYDHLVGGESAYFAWLNRGKESVLLDVKRPADLELLCQMVARADVFIQNLAPGAAQRLGLGAHQLTALHDRLIAVDIVGYGQDTTFQAMRAYDLLVQAEAGICAVTGTPDSPCKVGVSIADIATGMNAHSLILEALLSREKTGCGQAIEVAMFDGIADMMSVPLLHRAVADRDTPRCGLAHASIRPYGAFRCSDGHEIVIAIQNSHEWRRFCEGVLQCISLANDPRFKNNPDRVAHKEALDTEISAIVATLSGDELTARLIKHQIAYGRVSSLADVALHPALRQVQALMPSGDIVSMPRPAGRPGLLPSEVPALGINSRQIRTEFGGDSALPAQE